VVFTLYAQVMTGHFRFFMADIILFNGIKQ